MSVVSSDGALRFRPSLAGQVFGLLVSLFFAAIGVAIMVLARGPAMPGPLFVLIPAVFIVSIVRSFGLELLLDDRGIHQHAPLGASWSLEWSQIASWDDVRSQSQHKVSLRDAQGASRSVSSWLASGTELGTLVEQLSERLGAPSSASTNQPAS